MAEKSKKKKKPRTQIHLQCTECKRLNYTTQKNIRDDKGKLSLKKYCKWCKKVVDHKEHKVHHAPTQQIKGK